MVLVNFDTPLDVAGKRRIVQTVPNIAMQTTVTPLPESDRQEQKPAPASEQASYVARDTDVWTWQDLRDYVVREIESRFGTFPRDLIKESGIFKSFLGRWGPQAGPIAKAAFEVHGGMWRGAPISVTRFTKGSDPYFATQIADRL
jgi:hypothetical protein